MSAAPRGTYSLGATVFGFSAWSLASAISKAHFRNIEIMRSDIRLGMPMVGVAGPTQKSRFVSVVMMIN